MSGDNVPVILIIIACPYLENGSFTVLTVLEVDIKQLTARNRLAGFSDAFFMKLTIH